MNTKETLHLFKKMDISLENLIKLTELNLKKKIYQEKISFSQMFTSNKKRSKVNEYKAMKAYFPIALDKARAKIFKNISGDYKIISEDIIETKNGYDLKIIIVRKLSFIETVNRRIRFLDFNAPLDTFKYRREDNTFSFYFEGQFYRYRMTLSNADLGAILSKDIDQDFLLFLSIKLKKIERVFELELDCASHKWTVFKVQNVTNFIKNKDSYYMKDTEYLIIDNSHVIVFGYADHLFEYINYISIINNFEEIVKLKGVKDISPMEGYSKALLTTTNRLKKI